MSDLREALETIARGGVPIGISSAKWAEEWLAAHPVEPAPVVRCAKTTYGGVYGVVPCNEVLVNGACPQGQQHFIDDEPAPVQVEITDAAVGAARTAYSKACRDIPSDGPARFRAALEAAAPLLGPRPPGACGDPGCMTFEWGEQEGIDGPVLLCVSHKMPGPGWAYEVTDAAKRPLLDRGKVKDAIFFNVDKISIHDSGVAADAAIRLARPMPTREAVRGLLERQEVRQMNRATHLQVSEFREHLTNALLALLNAEGVRSDAHTCTGCGTTVIGAERCGDPTREGCRKVGS